MATVTGYTAARMKQIEDNAIVSGTVTNGSLILSRNNGQTVNAGSVIGPQGAQGPQGPSGVTAVTSTTRPGSPVTGQLIYETDTDRIWRWTGSAWRWVVGTGTSPYAIRLTNTATQAIAGGGTIDLAWTEELDRPNAFATPNFTVPLTGVYRFTGSIRVSPTAAGTWNPALDLLKAGAQFARIHEYFFTAISAGVMSFPIAYEAALTANDVHRFQLYSGGVGATVQANHFSNRLVIDLIGYN